MRCDARLGFNFQRKAANVAKGRKAMVDMLNGRLILLLFFCVLAAWREISL